MVPHSFRFGLRMLVEPMTHFVPPAECSWALPPYRGGGGVNKVITVRNSSCVKVVFTGVCLPTGGGCTPPGKHQPQIDIPQLGTPPEVATAADGTHPTSTGMYSCSIRNSHALRGLRRLNEGFKNDRAYIGVPFNESGWNKQFLH